MQSPCHLLTARLLQALLPNRQRFVERHPRLQQMSKLLGENEQLTVWNFQVLSRSRWRCGVYCFRLRLRADQIDANRHTLLQLNLSNRDGSVRAVQHAFDQAALRIASAISKLWHRRGK